MLVMRERRKGEEVEHIEESNVWLLLLEIEIGQVNARGDYCDFIC